MTLSPAQEVLLRRVKKYPKGVKVDVMQHRAAVVLQRKGLIEYDDWTGIAKLTTDRKEAV